MLDAIITIDIVIDNDTTGVSYIISDERYMLYAMIGLP